MQQHPASLQDVRQEIDNLDSKIIRLMADRSLLVQEAVRFKRDQSDVPAPERVAQVIAKVRAHASSFGMSPDVVEAAYRAMIEAFIKIETQTIKDRQTHPR